jgi:hypothetical protein
LPDFVDASMVVFTSWQSGQPFCAESSSSVKLALNGTDTATEAVRSLTSIRVQEGQSGIVRNQLE